MSLRERAPGIINLRIVWLDVEASQNFLLHIVILPGYNGIAFDKDKGVISITSLASTLKPKQSTPLTPKSNQQTLDRPFRLLGDRLIYGSESGK